MLRKVSTAKTVSENTVLFDFSGPMPTLPPAGWNRPLAAHRGGTVLGKKVPACAISAFICWLLLGPTSTSSASTVINDAYWKVVVPWAVSTSLTQAMRAAGQECT